VRFHYGRRGREGNYAASELGAWARKIGVWRRRAAVFAYFNNDWRGFAVANALALGELGLGAGCGPPASRRPRRVCRRAVAARRERGRAHRVGAR
jgi:uncharacterized protein YecE (DUF72 family)